MRSATATGVARDRPARSVSFALLVRPFPAPAFAAAVLLLCASAAAAIDASERCRSRKLLEASKYVGCLLKAEARLAQTGSAERWQKTVERCATKLDSRFVRHEQAAARAGDPCPTTGDAEAVRAALEADARRAAVQLDGLPRWVDRGDGTISDRRLGILWEKKVGQDGVEQLDDLHDADTTYRWAGSCSVGGKSCQPDAAAAAACAAGVEGDPTGCAECAPGSEGVCEVAAPGVTVWQWLVRLNQAEFAGYDDWRVPTRDEMHDLVDPLRHHPAIDPVFDGSGCGAACLDLADPACACTLATFHWTASTYAPNAERAWKYSFIGGIGITTPKAGDFLVARACRDE